MYRSLPFCEVDGERLFDYLNSSCLVPLRYGNCEPLRTLWDGKEEFQNDWNNELQEWFGMVWIKCSKPHPASIGIMMPYGPRSSWHNLTISIPDSKTHQKDAYHQLLEVTDRLFELLKFDYGYLCLNSEYWYKNMMETLVDGGKILREQAVGIDWPLYLPGIYWVNYLGSAYEAAGMDWRGLPGPILNELSNGVRIRLSEIPSDWKDDPKGTWNDALTQLGIGWFFSKDGEKPYLGLGDKHRDRFAAPRGAARSNKDQER